MLQQLKGKNFQKHQKITLDFDPLVTTIVGRTDAGKTALLRLLKWICLNTPAGTSFISHGKDSCSGILLVDNHKIVRRRTKFTNLYKLDDKTYKAFGSDVPADIASLLNLSEINFQDQITLPFWFCISPGQVSRELNSIINLGVIDQTLSAVATEVRKTRSEVELTGKRLEQARAERDSLAYVQQLDTDLQYIETVQNDITLKRVKIASLTRSLESVYALKNQLDLSLQAKADGGKALSLADRLRITAQRCKTLAGLLSDVKKAKQIITKGIPDIKPIAQLADRLDIVHSKRDRLQRLLGKTTELGQQWQNNVDTAIDVKEELSELAGTTCPLCNRPL